MFASYFLQISFGVTYLILLSSGNLIHRRDKRESEEILRVFLTVSSLASHTGDPARRIELNWLGSQDKLDKDEQSSVRLYDQDPHKGISSHLLCIRPNDHPSGYYRTMVQFPQHVFTRSNLTSDCLGYWIAYVSRDKLLATDCIRARPHWMSDMRDVIGRAALPDLVIAGTHKSGSYAPFDPNDDSLRSFIMTQDESIWNQLVYGVRYLDLQVDYHSEVSSTSSEHLWITHGLSFRTDLTVRRVIEDVKAFLISTDEIIIMDFHHFAHGFQDEKASERHQELIQMLEQELGDYMIPVSMSSWTYLNDLWTMNRRLYVGYASTSDRQQSSLLFPAVTHLRVDADDVDSLYNFLNNTVCDRKHHQGLRSAMAQQTPSAPSVRLKSFGGLRRLAHQVNWRMVKWFGEEWRHCTNIVSNDYFLGSPMVSLAIEINKERYGGSV